jgi:hypothetical protein
LPSNGVAYFNCKGNEYLIATNNAETTVSANDAIVELVGVTDIHHATTHWNLLHIGEKRAFSGRKIAPRAW